MFNLLTHRNSRKLVYVKSSWFIIKCAFEKLIISNYLNTFTNGQWYQKFRTCIAKQPSKIHWKKRNLPDM